jgi:DNA-binding Xre family transcriptional regulator
MLYNNLRRVLAEKSITNATGFLKTAGFSYKAAWGLVSSEMISVRLDNLEKLCLALNCTPNDLLHWVPNSNSNVLPSHPLFALKRDAENTIQSYLQKMPIQKLKEVKDFIKNLEP